MNAKQKAMTLVRNFENLGGGTDALAADIARSLAESVLEERTECALICDKVARGDDSLVSGATACATAIRARV